jgi:hypothetical protein
LLVEGGFGSPTIDKDVVFGRDRQKTCAFLESEDGDERN